MWRMQSKVTLEFWHCFDLFVICECNMEPVYRCTELHMRHDQSLAVYSRVNFLSYDLMPSLNAVAGISMCAYESVWTVPLLRHLRGGANQTDALSSVQGHCPQGTPFVSANFLAWLLILLSSGFRSSSSEPGLTFVAIVELSMFRISYSILSVWKVFYIGNLGNQKLVTVNVCCH